MVPMTIGVVGKGGVGKTTFTGLIARAYVQRGARVVAIDTDSNPNLGLSLGLSMAETEAIPVLPRSVLFGDGGTTTADELLQEYGRPTPAGPTLVSAIKVAEAGAGCTCGGHATVRGMLHDALAGVDVTLVDMEAGLEHLSRSGGTLAYADVLLVVCEPTRKSVLTARRTALLATELGIGAVLAVGNKARSAADLGFFEAAFAQAGLAVAGVVPFDPELEEADRADLVTLIDIPTAVQASVDAIIGSVDSLLQAV